MTVLDDIESRWVKMPALPWRVILDKVNGLPAPVGIVSDDGTSIVDADRGLVKGCGEYTIAGIRNRADALQNAKQDVDVLRLALLEACGGDREKAEFICQHAWKKVQQDCGQLPIENIFHGEV